MLIKKNLMTFAQRRRSSMTRNIKKSVGSDETNKFTFEVAKHIITLDIGIIVLIGSLNSNWIASQGVISIIDSVLLALSGATVAAFLFSIVCCVVVVFLIPYQLNNAESDPSQSGRV